MNIFEQIMMEKEEGIVLKDIRSKYMINGRDNSWIKMKADYIDNMVDSLDLIILGGYYQQNNINNSFE